MPLNNEHLIIASAITKRLLKVVKETKGDMKAVKREIIQLDNQIDTCIADLTVCFYI